jgi:hypothetical protein
MQHSRKRRLLPKPPDPPEGMMWLYWELVPIEDAEAHARKVMGNFDKLPRRRRDQLNYDSGRVRPKRSPR